MVKILAEASYDRLLATIFIQVDACNILANSIKSLALSYNRIKPAFYR